MKPLQQKKSLITTAHPRPPVTRPGDSISPTLLIKASSRMSAALCPSPSTAPCIQPVAYMYIVKACVPFGPKIAADLPPISYQIYRLGKRTHPLLSCSELLYTAFLAKPRLTRSLAPCGLGERLVTPTNSSSFVAFPFFLVHAWLSWGRCLALVLPCWGTRCFFRRIVAGEDDRAAISRMTWRSHVLAHTSKTKRRFWLG